MEITYNLFDKDYNEYHAASLAGLASTIRAWETSPDLGPKNVRCSFDSENVIIESELSEEKAIEELLRCAFRVDRDSLIYLPGSLLDLKDNTLARRLAIHQGLCSTVFQHRCARNIGISKDNPLKGAGQIILSSNKSDSKFVFSYTKVLNFYHQTTADILDKNKLSETCQIKQWVIPGAIEGVIDLSENWKNAFLLRFLIVACEYYKINGLGNYYDACVIPSVTNLEDFVSRRETYGQRTGRHHVEGYLESVVGGIPEAGMRNLYRGAGSGRVIVFGKVAWDQNQNNRVFCFDSSAKDAEISRYAQLYEAEKNERFSKIQANNKTKISFAVSDTMVSNLFANNCIRKQHWSCGMASLYLSLKTTDQQNKSDYLQNNFLKFNIGAKILLSYANELENALISAITLAWKLRCRELSEQNKKQHGSDQRFFEKRDKEKKKLCQEVAGCMLHRQVRSLVLKFIGESNSSLNWNPTHVWEYLNNPKNTNEIKDIFITSLVSDVRSPKNTDKNEEVKTAPETNYREIKLTI